MIYCEGTNCSKRDTCIYHTISEEEPLRQCLDRSTIGRQYGGFDENGHYICDFYRYDCGDMSENFPYYTHFGWLDTSAEDNCIIGGPSVAIGEPDLKPRTIIIETDNIIIRSKSLGFEIPLSNEAFEEADEIIINGYVFKKVKRN